MSKQLCTHLRKTGKKTYSSYTQWPKHRMQVHRQQQQHFLVFCAFIFLLFDDNANYAQSKMKNACITDLERWTVKIQQKNIQWIVEWVLRTFVQNKLKFEKKRKHSHNDKGKMNRNEWQRSLLNNWLHKAAQFLFWII